MITLDRSHTEELLALFGNQLLAFSLDQGFVASNSGEYAAARLANGEYIGGFVNKKLVVAAALTKAPTEYWSDDRDATYLNGFVSIPHAGHGKQFWKWEAGITPLLRLDCDVTNVPLVNYYLRHGFVAVGECSYASGRGGLLMERSHRVISR